MVMIVVTVCIICCFCEARNRKDDKSWQMTNTQLRLNTWPKGPILSPKNMVKTPNRLNQQPTKSRVNVKRQQNIKNQSSINNIRQSGETSNTDLRIPNNKKTHQSSNTFVPTKSLERQEFIFKSCKTLIPEDRYRVQFILQDDSKSLINFDSTKTKITVIKHSNKTFSEIKQ